VRNEEVLVRGRLHSLVRRPSPPMAVALVALAIAVGGVAYGAIPNSNGSISGCYNKKNGQLRVVDTGAGQSCSGSEVAISFAATDANGRVADANALGGQAPSAYTDVLDEGTDQFVVPPLSPGGCGGDSPVTTAPPGKIVVVSWAGRGDSPVNGGWVLTPYDTYASDSGTHALFTVCNTSSGNTVGFGITVHWAVLR
jgi:hypothetical protein